MSALQTLREILTPLSPEGSPKFSFIELVRPGFGFSEPRVRAGEYLTFRIGYEGDPPDSVTGHLFDDGTGFLIARIHGAGGKVGNASFTCTFRLPEQITAQRVCLIVEGERTVNGVASCEMTFLVEQ